MYSCLLDKQEFSYLSIGHMTSFRVLHSSSDDYLKKPNLSSTGERSFLCSSVGKASAHNVGDLGLIPSSGSSPGEGNGNPLVFLPGESHGQRSLAGYSSRGCKGLNTTEHAHTQRDTSWRHVPSPLLPHLWLGHHPLSSAGPLAQHTGQDSSLLSFRCQLPPRPAQSPHWEADLGSGHEQYDHISELSGNDFSIPLP